MKRFIAVLLSVFAVLTLFSGCEFNLTKLVKITPITTAVASNFAAQQETASSIDDAQTSLQEMQTSTPNTEGNVVSTSQAVTTKPTRTTTLPAQTTTRPPQTTTVKTTQSTTKKGIQPDGAYTTKEDVSLYIHTYKKLPNNFITKEQARALNWPGGSLEPYAPGKCIGGDHFGNYPNDDDVKPLPEASGRKYYECDIDTLRASSRGAKRLVYSNDGLIYYTPDHYDSFTKLY